MYDFPQKKFSIGHGNYSPIPDPSKNWSVKKMPMSFKKFNHEGFCIIFAIFFKMESNDILLSRYYLYLWVSYPMDATLAERDIFL